VLRILEDTNGDGRADKSTVFADKLSIPTGLVFIDGGVMVSQAPDFLFLKDTNGDDRADIREKRITGWRTNDTHAGPSNLRYGLDNWLWGTVGYAGFRGTVGAEEVRLSQNVYRFKADGSQLENITNFTNNTWGLGFSENFDVFGSTANNEHSVFVAIPNRYYRGVNGLRGDGRKKIDGHYAMHTITPNLRQVDSQGGYTAAAGHSLYTARSFPREYWNRIALVNEPTGHVVHRARLEPRGSGYAEVDGWNLMASDDEWWAPVHAEVGPDGAVWVLDWYNFIIQHNPRPDGFQMGAGNAYETPLRDKQHGRIYRIVWKGARPYQPIALSKDRPQELVEALRNDNMFWRTTAQRLLVERAQTDVVDALIRIAEDRSVDEIGLNAPAVHALWTMHGLKALDGSNARALDVARRALTHPAAGVRKTALMVLPRTESTLTEMLRAGSLTDANLNTRLSAFLAASEMPPSAEVGRLLYTASKDSSIIKDEWLPEALFIAAAKHSAGFLNAYAAEIGASEFARLAARGARGQLDTFVDWSAPDLDENGWLTAAVPALWATTRLGPFEGVVWFRREIQLPAGVEGKTATLRLGPVNDGDITYINGRRIGARADAADAVRQYPVPEGVLRAGRNLIAVRVSNRVGRGGILPDSAGIFLSGDDFRVDLAGDWRYRIEETWAGGRRRDIVASVPIAQQFLRHHNPVADIVKPDSVADATPPARQGPPPNVTRIVLGVLPGRNLFEVTTLTVQPGREVTLVFNNRDEMPHNVVLFDRTPFEQIESALNAMLSDPNAADRGYVPLGANVLSATPLVQPQQSATITFTAPATPGDYPFVCTFPGHWLTMRGVLRVEL
jgi:putative membrane-bound dehydrogenase-like protein